MEGLRARNDRHTPSGLGNIARAFAHRNYRIYVAGNSISLIGWWLERVAVGWLTWTLTHSGAWLGLISLADFLPVLFIAPFAGVLADRRDRVWTIRITQWIGCVQASLLAILVISDAMTIEILFALVLMLGIASGAAHPSRLALIPTLVGRGSLASALAINSVVFNLARFIGPALAGIVIAEVGIAAAFAVNAVSYIAFQISLLNLRELPPQPAVGRQNVLRASVDAFSYAYRHPGIGPMLLLFVVTTIGTRGFIELFPGFADRVFGRGPEGLAMLTSTVGLGAIFGASWMVLRSAITGLATVVLVCTLIMSLAILIGRTIFSQYLIDREVLKPEHLQRLFGPSRLRDTLRSVETAARLFDGRRETFNGDLFPPDVEDERVSVRTEHLARLADFLDGHEAETGQLSA